jgi:hypothetical protein
MALCRYLFGDFASFTVTASRDTLVVRESMSYRDEAALRLVT